MTVDEIMDRELFHVRADDEAAPLVGQLLAVGASVAPVLDADGCPLGVVAWSDLVDAPPGVTAGTCMSRPPSVVREDSTVEEAARRFDETGHQHLVVLDSDGRAVGMLSAVAVVRALLDRPDEAVAWTASAPLDAGSAAAAPDAPGVLVLLFGDGARPEVRVWIEDAVSLRRRLLALAPSRLLRFRLAVVIEDHRRRAIAARILREVRARSESRGGALWT